MTGIEDYALIGDCHTAALVSKGGSIDWFCLPRFDSEACFAARVVREENGRWLIAPQSKVRDVSRRYRDGKLVLETTFATDEGEVTLVDRRPPRTETPQLVLRFDYGLVDLRRSL